MAAFTPAFRKALDAWTAAIQDASEPMELGMSQMRQAYRPYILHDPGRIKIWDDDKLDIEPDAVRPRPKRVDMRGFGEVEL
jgi:hypothetical protein